MLSLSRLITSSFLFQEGLVEKLFSWAQEAPPPLCVYATGLLARAMGNQEVVAHHREENAQLVSRGSINL